MNETLIIGIGTSVGCAAAFAGAYLTSYADVRIRGRGYLLTAAGAGVLTLACALTGAMVGAAINAASAAMALWFWWNNGGGDGMRRAWKRVRGRFTVLRGAPSTA